MYKKNYILRFKIVYIYIQNYMQKMSCVANISSVSGLCILDCPFGFL